MKATYMITLVELVGLGVITAGIAMIYPPAAVIFVGACTLVAANWSGGE